MEVSQVWSAELLFVMQGIGLASSGHLCQAGWQMTCLYRVTTDTGDGPTLLHRILSLMPAVLPSISVAGVEVRAGTWALLVHLGVLA